MSSLKAKLDRCTIESMMLAGKQRLGTPDLPKAYKAKKAQNLQLLRAFPHNGDILSVPRSFRNYQWNRVVEGSHELTNP